MKQVKSRIGRVFLVGLALAACEGEAGPTGPAGPDGVEGPAGPQGPGAPQPATIELAPTPLVLSDGFSRELAAVVRTDDGSEISGAGVVWTSEDGDVASLSPLTGETVDPSKVLVTGEGHGVVTITATIGSVSAETSAQCCFPVEPDAFFSVRSGTELDPTFSKSFDADTDEVFIEIPLDFPTLETVYVRLQVNFPVGGPNDEAVDFDVATYAADGVADVGDYGSGTFLVSLTKEPLSFGQLAVDVTSVVTALKNAGETHLGLRIYGASSGVLTVSSPFVDAPFPDGS